MERTTVIRVVRAVLGLLLAAPLLAVLAVSRALAPSDLAAAGMSWVPIALATALVVVATVAAGMRLAAGLRTGAADALVQAAGSAALAGGALAWMAGADLVFPSVLAALSLVAAAILGRRQLLPDARGARAGVAAILLVVVELSVVVELLPAAASTLDAIRLPVAVLGGAAAAAASLEGGRRGGGAVAAAVLVGVAGMALAPESPGVESVLGLAALLMSQLLVVIVATDTAAPRAETFDHRLPDLAAQLPDAVLAFDGSLLLRDWNPAAAGLLGLDAASGGARLEDLLGVALNELPLPGGPVAMVQGIGGLRIRLVRSGDGLTAVVRDQEASPETDRLGRELRGTIEELLQARRTIDLQRQELERASSVDALTGVPNRAAILERLRTEVAEARRYQHPVAVVLFDLDGFAAINRAHGAAAGDDVLREVALRIRLRVREADELGRVGSDSFLAVLPHTEESGAATFADALQHRLGLRPIAVDDQQIAPTASVGVAVMRPGDDLDADGLLARADEALASAKRAGGNRIALDRLHGLARLEDPHGVPERPDESGAV